MLGVASHRAARRFAQLTAIRILPMQLEGYGSVSMYWHPDNANRSAVAAAIECLRACAAPQAEGWEKVQVV